MLIDTFLPEYQFSEHHDILINRSREQIYSTLRSFVFQDATLIRWLFRLRGLPSSALTLNGLQKIGFVILGELPNQELVLGLIGRFWSLRGDLQKIDPNAFKKFDRAGFAKAVWNFSLSPQPNGGTRVKTETRIHCLDVGSYQRFRRYWLVIGPFSGLIRKEILRALKKQTEASRIKSPN